jgi:hypothetical protein
MATNNIRTSGGIFTHHFIESLLQDTLNHPAIKVQKFALPRQEKFSEKELEARISTAWEALIERWDAVEREFGTLDISALRQRWLRPLFFYLKIEPEFQRADIVLDGDLRFPISHLGRVGTTEFTLPVHSVLYDKEAKSDTLETRVGTGRGMKKVAPHDMVQRYLNLSKEHDWALLTDGVYLRLLRDFHHTYTRGYIEFDLQGIFNSRDFAGFRAMYRLLHASRFVIDAEKEAAPMDALYEDALAMGVRVGEDLRKNVQAAIESLANGFLISSPGFIERISQQEDGSAQLYRDVLMTIYRMLFLLFAEQRSMLPGRGSLYMESFSLTAFRTLAEQPASEDRNLDLWEQIKTTFSMVEHGVNELGIFAYNGALFSLKRTPLLTPDDPTLAPRCRNDYFMRTVRHLTVVEKDKVRQRISYSDLSVEEIGSIYESLLEFTPQISKSQLEVEGRQIPANTFFLDPRGTGRKTTGSYYTPPSLVNELIKSALVPVMEDRIQAVVPGYDPELVEALTDEERQAAEEAILALNVVDPAAGSGAFLIAANNKLALELARIRSGEYFPPEDVTQHARRDVLAHCIYGVDLNPMAIELCKVSLWINAAVEDAPLNFLDHHIRWGNSLVGATPELIKEGIPNDAYKPVTGDDKDIAKVVKAQNSEELKGQLGLMRVTSIKTQQDLQTWAQFTKLAEIDPGQAEATYFAYFGSDDYWEKRLPYDLWTAAFFAPLVKDQPIPTTQDVRQAQAAPTLVVAELKAQARQLAERYNFFHWHLEFPEIFDVVSTGGFDVVLGNPPWEKVQPEENQFFRSVRPDIATATGSKRKTLIKNLQEESPILWKKWNEYKSGIELFSKFSRYSGKNPYSAAGNLNTATLFTECFYLLISGLGKSGILIPSVLATNNQTKDFFAYLMSQNAIQTFFDFENRNNMFPDVHSRFRFCLMTLSGSSYAIQKADFCFFLHNVSDLLEEERHFTLNDEDLLLMSPNTGTSPTFSNKTNSLITKAIYQRSSVFIIEDPSEYNPWDTRIYAEMFNMTRASHLFKEFENLQDEGYSITGSLFVNDKKQYFPVYEARMLWYYDHRAASIGINPDNVFRSAVSKTTHLSQYQDPEFQTLPRYWISKDDFTNPILDDYPHGFFLGFRMITAATNERTLIAGIFPKFPYVNTISVLFNNFSAGLYSALTANLSSLVLDYVTRQRIIGVALNFFVFKQLPVLPPNRYTVSILNYLIPKVLELIYNAWDLSAFADEVWQEANSDLRSEILAQHKANQKSKNEQRDSFSEPAWVKYLEKTFNITERFPKPPFKWDPERRFILGCELDALFGHLYGLTRDEFDYILETFPIVKRKDEAKYSEYRTKRLILEEFDKLADDPMLEGVCVPLNERVSALEYPEEEQPAPPKRPKSVTQDPVFSSLEPAMKTKPGEEKPIRKPKVPENQTQLFAEETDFSATKTDWNRYRCQKCEISVMGFSIEEHTKEVHGGRDPGYIKIR